jgi:hypothetical protein
MTNATDPGETGSTSADLDSQQVEILGRNIVKGAIIEANLEVATPERDNGIDLIMFRWSHAGEFRARPIQIKAASKFSFGMDRKYEKIPGLIMVFVLACRKPCREVYAMTYRQMVGVGRAMGWTKTDSWKERDGYSTRHLSPKLKGLLRPYLMNSQKKWRRLMARTPQV